MGCHRIRPIPAQAAGSGADFPEKRDQYIVAATEGRSWAIQIRISDYKFLEGGSAAAPTGLWGSVEGCGTRGWQKAPASGYMPELLRSNLRRTEAEASVYCPVNQRTSCGGLLVACRELATKSFDDRGLKRKLVAPLFRRLATS